MSAGFLDFVVRRSGAVGGSAIRPISAGRGSVCVVGEALRGLADGGIEGGVRSALGQRGDWSRGCTCDCSRQ